MLDDLNDDHPLKYLDHPLAHYMNGPLVKRAVDKDLTFAESFATLRLNGLNQKAGSESATPQQQADTIFDIKVGLVLG